MLFKIIVILIAVGGTFGKHTKCYLDGLSQCNHIQQPHTMPDTFEELKQDCNVIQQALTCALGVSENCPGSENFTEKLKKLLKYLETNCDEESDIYSVISQNYACILPIARNIGEECSLYRFHTDDLNTLMSILDDMQNITRCLNFMYNIVCAAHVIGLKCGMEVKYVATDILKNVKFEYEDCRKEGSVKLLLPFQAAVESAITRSRQANTDTTLRCPKEKGKFGVPADCTSYLRCKNGTGKIKRCPEGLLFDSTKKCTVPEDNVDCGFPTPEQKELNSYCKSFYGYFPHQKDCHKYVMCHEGRGFLKTCPENTAYIRNSGCQQSDNCP